MDLPKLSHGLTKPKVELLEELGKRNGKPISEIAEEMGKTRGMLYQHLKELKEMGYVDGKFYITDAGRLALL
ncbi:ArsR family transcriptional regulator [Candidatus Micrarchaeota archaeon]|nr:ArsR family transcriptional regulator [Candidatus Micrarchaeota archaeon]